MRDGASSVVGEEEGRFVSSKAMGSLIRSKIEEDGRDEKVLGATGIEQC